MPFGDTMELVVRAFEVVGIAILATGSIFAMLGSRQRAAGRKAPRRL